MQEIISGFVTSLVDKDPYLEELVQKLKENKRNKELKKITNVESVDIFDEIVSGSPWNSEE